MQAAADPLMELGQKFRADLRERDRQEQQLANSNTSGQQSSNTSIGEQQQRGAPCAHQVTPTGKQTRAAASNSNPGEAASNSNSEPPTKKPRAGASQIGEGQLLDAEPNEKE